MIPLVDLKAQYDRHAEALDAAVQEVLASGRYVFGPNVSELEAEVARHLGSAHAVSCGSGSDALLLSLLALGIGAGDEVITTPFTFAATAGSICHSGARPVFVDIDPRSYNLDPAAVEAAITPATRAILAVHIFGQPAHLSALADIAERHQLLLVEDCAQSFGATWDGRPTGTVGATGCFSFFPSKNLGSCGDGGMVITDRDDVATTLRQLRNHGGIEAHNHQRLGFNSRLDELQAAILRVRLRHLPADNAARQRIAAQYNEGLQGLPGVTLPHADPGGEHVYGQYTIALDQRDALRDALQQRGVASAVYYPRPLYQQPAYREYQPPAPLPIAEQLAARCLSLPMFPALDSQRVEQVIQAVRASLS